MKIGRNAPCPCGSGKKYKKCCLKLDRANPRLAIETPIRQTARRADAWQADILPVPVAFDEEPQARPAAVMVTADGFVLFTELLSRPSAEVEDIAAELHRGIFEAGAQVSSFPPAIEVRESEVAAALARRIRDAGSPIPVRVALLEGVETAMASLNQAMGGREEAIVPTSPTTWAGWGHPGDWIAEVFRAAAAYYRAGPWRHFDDFPPVIAETAAGEVWYLSILGSGGIERGLAFHSDPEDLESVLDGDLSMPVGQILSLTFDSGRDLRRAMRREIAKAGWEVAAADAYPVLFAIGTPAGGLRRTVAGDLVAILSAVAAWAKAIDADRRVLDQRPWRDPGTGVELDVQGELFEPPVVTLEAGCAEGPGARPEGALEWRREEIRGPRPVDEELLGRFTAELESEGLSTKTVNVHTDNAALFLDYLTNWAGVPVAAVHELDLRSFLFDWYPRKVGASKTEAGRLFVSVRRFFRFLERDSGIFCHWVPKLLEDKPSFMARWEASPGGFFWDEDVVDWQHDHFANLDAQVLSPSHEIPGVLVWGGMQGITEAMLHDELKRHWLLWREEVILSGLTQSDEVRAVLDQRAVKWATTPHARYGDSTPARAIEDERDESRRRYEAERDADEP